MTFQPDPVEDGLQQFPQRPNIRRAVLAQVQMLACSSPAYSRVVLRGAVTIIHGYRTELGPNRLQQHAEGTPRSTPEMITIPKRAS